MTVWQLALTGVRVEETQGLQKNGILVQEEIFILSLLILQNRKLRPRDLPVVTADWRKSWPEAWTSSLPVNHPFHSGPSPFL